MPRAVAQRRFGFRRAWGIALGALLLPTLLQATPERPRRTSAARDRGDSRPIQAAALGRPGAPVELRWQARTEAAGGSFRVYRLGPGGESWLLAEVSGRQGIARYRVSDRSCWEGSCRYSLTFVAADGQELTLGKVERRSIESRPGGSDPGAGRSVAGALPVMARQTEPSGDAGGGGVGARRGSRVRPRPAVPPPRHGGRKVMREGTAVQKNEAQEANS